MQRGVDHIRKESISSFVLSELAGKIEKEIYFRERSLFQGAAL